VQRYKTSNETMAVVQKNVGSSDKSHDCREGTKPEVWVTVELEGDFQNDPRVWSAQ
jgi:hypothetical protein